MSKEESIGGQQSVLEWEGLLKVVEVVSDVETEPEPESQAEANIQGTASGSGAGKVRAQWKCTWSSLDVLQACK